MLNTIMLQCIYIIKLHNVDTYINVIVLITLHYVIITLM